jgi:hypothetical protein
MRAKIRDVEETIIGGINQTRVTFISCGAKCEVTLNFKFLEFRNKFGRKF